jgi:hypothetical protein
LLQQLACRARAAGLAVVAAVPTCRFSSGTCRRSSTVPATDLQEAHRPIRGQALRLATPIAAGTIVGTLER